MRSSSFFAVVRLGWRVSRPLPKISHPYFFCSGSKRGPFSLFRTHCGWGSVHQTLTATVVSVISPTTLQIHSHPPLSNEKKGWRRSRRRTVSPIHDGMAPCISADSISTDMCHRSVARSSAGLMMNFCGAGGDNTTTTINRREIDLVTVWKTNRLILEEDKRTKVVGCWMAPFCCEVDAFFSSLSCWWLLRFRLNDRTMMAAFDGGGFGFGGAMCLWDSDETSESNALYLVRGRSISRSLYLLLLLSSLLCDIVCTQQSTPSLIPKVIDFHFFRSILVFNALRVKTHVYLRNWFMGCASLTMNKSCFGCVWHGVWHFFSMRDLTMSDNWNRCWLCLRSLLNLI